MADRDASRGLLGRDSECETLDRLLRSVRSGRRRVLVLRGEAEIGKTALLEYVVERARGVASRGSAPDHFLVALAVF